MAQQSLMEDHRASNMAMLSDSEQFFANNQQYMSSGRTGRDVLAKTSDAKLIKDFHKFSKRNLNLDSTKTYNTEGSMPSQSRDFKDFFEDDPLTKSLLHNPQILLGSSIKAHTLDLIKNKIN